jgi:syntaxin 7
VKSRTKVRESTSLIQQQLMIERNKAEIDFQNQLIEERDKGIKDIAGQMQEVHDIFQQFALMVDEQGRDVDLISDNIQVANKNVDKGRKEIEKANESQKSSCVLL